MQLRRLWPNSNLAGQTTLGQVGQGSADLALQRVSVPAMS